VDEIGVHQTEQLAVTVEKTADLLEHGLGVSARLS
jgi:hypothetical protein